MVSKFAYSAIIACLLFTALVLGCSAGTKQQEPEPARESSFNYTVRFCSMEDCLRALATELTSAKKSVSCALYGIDSSLLSGLSSFQGSAASNFTMAVVVDENAKIAERFLNNSSAGGFVFKRNSKGIMHNKYCIIDDAQIITGSFNPTAAAKKDYNNLLIINSTNLAAFYSHDFNFLEENSPQPHTKIKSPTRSVMLNNTLVKAYFCPQDDCAAAVENELEKASSSILFAAYSFTSAGIANELILKSREGVAVSGIMEKSTTGSKYSKHAMMVANGVNVRLESSRRLMHHKFFVIDNRTVITGSFNPTENADTRNDENIIIIENAAVAEEYAAEFSTIYGVVTE